MAGGRKRYSLKEAFLACEEINGGAKCACREARARRPCNWIAALFRMTGGNRQEAVRLEQERVRRNRDETCS